MGDIIREKRESLRLTQTELAELVGVSCKSISAYELEVRRPSLKVMSKLIKVLKIPTKIIRQYYI